MTKTKHLCGHAACQALLPGNVVLRQRLGGAIRNMESWKNGTLSADLSELEAKAQAGDPDAKARLRMLKGIDARRQGMKKL